ncbi:MAG: transposase [Clostridia bacterium]|nr:transposase [Clostridia bacterium]
MENHLPKRKSTRLKNFDYSNNGYYFITICTYERRKILSKIVGEGLRALPIIELTAIGEKVNKAINFINVHYGNISVDKYIIMPDHIHMIIKIETGGHGDPPLQIQDVIGGFKSFTTHEFGKTLWQRSFYDHVIRNQNDYREIWEYIENNPYKLLEKSR